MLGQARLGVFYFDVGIVPALMTISDAMDKDTPAKLFSEALSDGKELCVTSPEPSQKIYTH